MIADIVSTVAYVLAILIFVRAILSWFPSVDPRNPLVDILFQVTEPILAPIRTIMPRTMVDFSPMIATFVLMIIARAVSSA